MAKEINPKWQKRVDEILRKNDEGGEFEIDLDKMTIDGIHFIELERMDKSVPYEEAAHRSINEFLDRLFGPEEEEVVCPALELLGLYEQREALRIERDAMGTFVLPCEPEWATKTELDNAIIRITEQIRRYGEVQA